MDLNDDPISNEEKQGYSNDNDQAPKEDNDFEDLLHFPPCFENDEDAKPINENDQFSKDLLLQKDLTLNPNKKNLSENGKILMRYNRYDVIVGLKATCTVHFSLECWHVFMFQSSTRIGD